MRSYINFAPLFS